MTKTRLKPYAVVRFKIGVKTLADVIKQLKDSGADALIGRTVGLEDGVISASRQAACRQPAGRFHSLGLGL